MRLAIYARCSTAEQTVDHQLDGLREYEQARGFEVVDEYLDEGVSGAKAQRPALDRLLADAHRRRFDAVLIWKLDRLGRSLSHLIRLVDTFGSLGIDLVSLGDPGLDTTSPHGRLLFSVMGAVAEFERELIRERTRSGVAASRRMRPSGPSQSRQRRSSSGASLRTRARALAAATLHRSQQ